MLLGKLSSTLLTLPWGRPEHRKRQDYESYLAWRTARGFTATFEAMLTQPFVIHYYDELYFGTGIAARGAVAADAQIP